MKKAKHLSLSGEEHNEEAQPKRFLVDIGHPEYVWLIQPEISSWSLIKKEEMGNALCDAQFLERLLHTCEDQARFPDEEIQCDGSAKCNP